MLDFVALSLFARSQRDPALFPESRVRPWVVDEEAEFKVSDEHVLYTDLSHTNIRAW